MRQYKFILSGGGTGGHIYPAIAIANELKNKFQFFKKSDKFNFLGDDLSIISSNGMVFLNPMPANIYPYNVECFPELQKYLNEKMSFSERMLWALRNFFLGPKKAMKRISAPEDKVKAKKISLNTVFYLSRENIKDIVVKKVDIVDLSYVSKNILLDEFKNKCLNSDYLNYQKCKELVKNE
jgi:hypothetical protein